MRNKILLILICSFTPLKVYGWNGYDWSKSSFIEIEKGQLVREGEEIEIFDYGDGEYKNIEIDSMEKFGHNVEINGTDSETGEERTFEME